MTGHSLTQRILAVICNLVVLFGCWRLAATLTDMRAAKAEANYWENVRTVYENAVDCGDIAKILPNGSIQLGAGVCYWGWKMQSLFEQSTKQLYGAGTTRTTILAPLEQL